MKGVSSWCKVDVIVRLEFELVYYDSVVQRFDIISYYLLVNFTSLSGCLRHVMLNAMDCRIVEHEFDLQSR